MDRYQRVKKPKAETPIDENEIRITSLGRARNYITYAMTLLQEKGSTEVVFKAMGRAINKTVTIVELIKRRIPDLHQNTSIGSTDITDTWEPIEEGLLPLETTRHVSMITITLSKKELNRSSVGYQCPIPIELVKPLGDIDYEGRGNEYVNVEYEDGDWERNQSYGRGRGRGRGRSSRGRGRGGYNGPPNEYDAPQDGGYGYDAPPHEHRGYDDRGGYDGPPQGRGGYDGPPQGRGGYDGPPQGRGGYDGPQQGRGGYDGPPQGRGNNNQTTCFSFFNQ
ncbi:unnamed protein product [Arabis nemorensis]|uniref:DNA/RNA-binding protein Alba-like domain-containing protein n=1 Tax=Arabis nemorensis TaxID=586526 RepID=A0A565B1A1_9BRAS|nr:unnamed protein product [Arabis nemorensis]